jgi:hypothetical protein
MSRAPYLNEEDFQALPREDQEKYLNLLTEEVKYRKSRKLLSYVPYPKQKNFHTSDCPTRAIFGGNRTGKTTCGGIDFLFHITGMYPEWYPKHLRMTGSVIGRIIAKDFQKGVGEVIIPFLEEWLDASLVARKQRNPLGIPVKWVLKNGSVFDILTHEQTTEQFEGWRGHIAWFDEPPPRDKYVATLRGLVDFSGRNWLTLTPLTQPWIYDSIYTKADNKSVFVETVDIRENPYLSESAIKEFERNLTEEEKEARLHGRFLHLTGLIYKEFQPDIHICEPPKVQSTWTKYFCIDPHERMPTACLWLAVDDRDRHWVYDELWLPDMSLGEMAQAILAQEAGEKPHFRFIDPHNDKDNAIAGGFNVRRELMKYGIFCQRANSDPALGKSRIKMALKPQFSQLTKQFQPQLRISRTCPQTIYEFQHYQWASYRRNVDEYDLKEQVKKKSDHFMDCLRYIYNFGPRYVPQDQWADDEEVVYTGEYTKYPTRMTQPASDSSGYHNLVEERE